MGSITKIWQLKTLEAAESHIRNEEGNSVLQLANFISDEFVEEEEPISWIDSTNPKTGKIFAQLPATHSRGVERAVAAAQRAFPDWSRTTRDTRSRMLRRISELIQEERELFAVWESIDQGKTLERARVEVDRAIANFSYFSTYILHEENAVRMIDSVALTYEHRSAAGPFVLISPWNMPLYLLTWKIAPCIAFGCTGVAKPSEVTSMTAFLLAKVFQEAKLPAGVMNIVFGGGSTGASLVKHPEIKGVSFTGGTATGIQIRKDTAAHIGKHLSLELGGKNPTIVFEDVDLDRAVGLATKAAFENTGEICLCGSRIYVQKSIYDRFLDAMVSHVRASYRLKDNFGAVVSLQHYQKVRSYLVQASAESATFHTGGIPPENPKNGYWIEPTVLTDLSTSSIVMTEEIFGPVVTIAPFETEHEAIRLANDNPNGLAAVLMTNDGSRMRRVAEQLDSGLVWINCWLVRELGTAFGGMKSSGVGREGGSHSRDVFTNVRTIHLASQ